MSGSHAVDSHQHFWWDPSEVDYPWMTGKMAPIRRTFDPVDLRPALTRTGIDFTVLVQTRSSLEETRAFLDLAERTDFLAGVVGWVDLTDPDVAETLRDLQAGPGGQYLVSIRHQVHDEDDPAWLLRDDVLRGLEAVVGSGLVYDLLVRTRELSTAFEVARQFPDARFVIDHIAKPPIASGAIDAWARGMEPFSRLPNVHCKLSGMGTEAGWEHWTVDDLMPYAQRVLDWFGPDRLMFGSDWPVCLLAASYEEVVGVARQLLQGLPEGVREDIMGTNAIRCYGLTLTGSKALDRR